MNKRRKAQDGLLNGLTVICTAIAIFVLASIFVFVFQRGSGTISWQMLTGRYWAENVNLIFSNSEPGEFLSPGDLPADQFFSSRYGFAVKDSLNHEKENLILITYIAEGSPLKSAVINTAGENYLQPHSIPIGSEVQRFEYINERGVKRSAGPVVNQDARGMVETLDTISVSLAGLFYKSPGGGVWGSVLTTFMLIGISLVIALPIGIFAAIYLTEVAKKNRMTALIRSAIEMLAGVPSIIFGLMGIAVFFPITAFAGAKGPSILLGGITLAVILLPVIIRQTEEALLVVPQDLRFGSLSLGASETQTIFKVILPNAISGILTATLLSISRVIGESAALIYTIGTFVNDSPRLLSGATSLAVQIWSIMGGEQPNFELASAISIIILFLVLILNLSIKLISRQFNRKWSV